MAAMDYIETKEATKIFRHDWGNYICTLAQTIIAETFCDPSEVVEKMLAYAKSLGDDGKMLADILPIVCDLDKAVTLEEVDAIIDHSPFLSDTVKITFLCSDLLDGLFKCKASQPPVHLRDHDVVAWIIKEDAVAVADYLVKIRKGAQNLLTQKQVMFLIENARVGLIRVMDMSFLSNPHRIFELGPQIFDQDSVPLIEYIMSRFQHDPKQQAFVADTFLYYSITRMRPKCFDWIFQQGHWRSSHDSSLPVQFLYDDNGRPYENKLMYWMTLCVTYAFIHGLSRVVNEMQPGTERVPALEVVNADMFHSGAFNHLSRYKDVPFDEDEFALLLYRGFMHGRLHELLQAAVMRGYTRMATFLVKRYNVSMADEWDQHRLTVRNMVQRAICDGEIPLLQLCLETQIPADVKAAFFRFVAYYAVNESTVLTGALDGFFQQHFNEDNLLMHVRDMDTRASLEVRLKVLDLVSQLGFDIYECRQQILILLTLRSTRACAYSRVVLAQKVCSLFKASPLRNGEADDFTDEFLISLKDTSKHIYSHVVTDVLKTFVCELVGVEQHGRIDHALGL